MPSTCIALSLTSWGKLSATGQFGEVKVIIILAKIIMTLTSPNCPVAESLPQEVKDSAMQVEGIEEVDLDLVFEPPWEKSMMSEAAKLELNL